MELYTERRKVCALPEQLGKASKMEVILDLGLEVYE